MTVDTPLAERLAVRALELVNIPSASRDEARIAAYVAWATAGGPLELVHEAGETLLYATPRRQGTDLVLLAGHLDTVPAQGNIPGRVAGGAVHGLGATDMKGGLAVMIELARWLAEEEAELVLDLALLFFPREELPAEESALPDVFASAPLVREAGLVVVLEPTDNTIQAGCLGNLNTQLSFRGESAHSARPWLGVNAIERAVAGLGRVLPVEPAEVEISGLVFTEVLSATQIEGGIASNGIPDRAACILNYRYAPNRTPAEAEERVRELLRPAGGEVTIQSNSPPARVAANSRLVRRLQRAGSFALEAKQAWTPVAEFAAEELDAVNLGPGATRYAHRRDEQVEIAELVRTFTALKRFLLGSF